MYKILRDGIRYNTKKFRSYEEARKYIRRLITRLVGSYYDDYSKFGFKVAKI